MEPMDSKPSPSQTGPPNAAGASKQREGGSHTRPLWLQIGLAVLRLLAILLLFSLVLRVAAELVPGVDATGVGTPGSLALTVLVVTLVIWPLFIRYFLRVAVWTAGLAALVVNGVIILIAAWISPSLQVDNLGWAILYSLVVSILETVLLGLVPFGDVQLWRRLQRRMRGRTLDRSIAGKPGVIFLEIDGLSHDALLRAMAAGKAPTLKRWLDSGSHSLVGWECDLSSQTSASQAGILHGNNAGIPAFRWFDKAQGRVVVSSKPRDVAGLEGSLSNGDGLLAHGGTARASMLSGDADQVMLVASRIREESVESYRSFFFSPTNFTRTLSLVAWEILLEIGAKRRQRRRNEEPRIDRHLQYALVRAAMTVALRDFSLYTIEGDMLSGVPYCYATLAGYDEVAHHSGLDRHDTLSVLKKLDSRFKKLEAAAAMAVRDYRFVVLSDHGQTQGATFLQRYGLTLESQVRALVGEGATVGGPSTYATEGSGAGVSEGQSDWEHVSTVDSALEESGFARGRIGKAVRRRLAADAAPPTDTTDLVVLASGNTGLISFTKAPHRVTFEEMERDHPGLIDGLVGHPGIGFVMVATEDAGPVTIGGGGRHYLSDGRVEGEDPLAVYGPNPGRHLLRTNGFATCPDILVISTYWPEEDQDAAFEELVGNHGGLGGEQSRPFLMYPAEFDLVEQELVGAESIYRTLKHWAAATA